MTRDGDSPQLQSRDFLIKVCGLTRVDNAVACAKAGADLIGLVFFPKSPRHLAMARAREISSALKGLAPTCGVFVDADYEAIMETVDTCGLRAVQLHGCEPPALAARLSAQGLEVIKAFFATRMPTLDTVTDYPNIGFILAEYGTGVLPGGNAETWDYATIAGNRGHAPLMLAGGLSPENVAKAIAAAAPRAVDASSGLESSPGIKDIDRTARFIKNAREAWVSLTQ